MSSGIVCQLCGKEGHTVLRCCKRFDASFTGPPQKSTSWATSSYGVDTNWYKDSDATDHITGELEKLTVRDKYDGGEQVHAANGTGMEIDLLVIALCIPLVVIFISIISFMFQKLARALFL